MNPETLVRLGVVYAIGFYATAFVMGMLYANANMEFDAEDWFVSILWPICIPMLMVFGLMAGFTVFCKLVFSMMERRFPAMARFVQRTLKYARTAIFAVSLLFRPVKFGEIVDKRIFWKGKQ